MKALAILFAISLPFAPETAVGGSVKGEYATSKLALHRVGQINAQLSRLCRKGLFKQRHILRKSIGFIGKEGKGVTGIAQRGWNLYDPRGVAQPNKTYHFFNQGYSNCRVYVADTPRRPRNRQ